MDFILSAITVQQVYVFLKVVEIGSFTGAGEQLHMTQSAVSKSIAKFEQNLGITLFDRNNRELKLTDSGKMLYEEWKPLFQAINSSYRKVIQSQDTMGSTLRIGLTNAACTDRYFWKLEQQLHDNNPSLHLQLESKNILDLIDGLRDNLYDAVMVPDFEHYSLETEDLDWKWVARSNAFIITPSDHALAHRRSVKMEDLVDQSFVILRHGHTDNYYRDLKSRFEPFFSVPKVQITFQSVYDIRAFYRSNSGALFFADDYFDDPSDPDFVRIPVEDQYNGIICGFKTTNHKAALRQLLKILPESDLSV